MTTGRRGTFLRGDNMSEQITLTSPITKPPQTLVKIDQVHFDITNMRIEVRWLGENGEAGSAVYPTPAIPSPAGPLQPSGDVLISQINTGNNTTTSMAKKILQRIQTDGYVGAGSVTGTPS